MRSESCISHESRERINRSVVVSQNEDYAFGKKREKANESVQSQLNRSFINEHFSPKQENSYGEIIQK